MYLFYLPAGWAGVSITTRGIYGLTLPAATREEAIRDLVRSPRETTDDGLFQKLVEELTAYFTGARVDFGFPVDLEDYRDFGRRVLQELAAIPWGSTRTYGEVAAAVGKPLGARAVGQTCGANRIPLVIPCHRVTAAGGGLGGFSGGLDWKGRLLALEGTQFPDQQWAEQKV